MDVSREGGRTRWVTKRGTLELWMASEDVVVERFEGHASIEFVDPILDFLEAVIARGIRPRVFDDWELATSYDTAVRNRMTAWTLKHRKEIAQTHILVRSRLLAMGVTVANLAVGGSLRVYSSRDAFERALYEALQSEAGHVA